MSAGDGFGKGIRGSEGFIPRTASWLDNPIQQEQNRLHTGKASATLMRCYLHAFASTILLFLQGFLKDGSVFAPDNAGYSYRGQEQTL